MKYKDLKCCVIDTGNWIPVAEKMAEEFGKVYYVRPQTECDFMTTKEHLMGEGYGIEVVESLFLPEVLESDLFVFTDCIYGDLQEYLKKLGKNVWGAGETSWMELDRFALKEWQEEEKMPYPEYKEIRGVEKLLNVPPEEFIKVNNWARGDVETIKHYDKDRNKTRYYELMVKFGGYAEKMRFMTEKKIDGIEIGYDGWTVDGKFPEYAMWGVEIKNKCYLGKIDKQSNMPEPIRYINEKCGKVYKKEKTRCTYSNEIRISKGKAYLTDQTMRFPLPPYQAHLCMWKNFVECVYEGSKGNLVTPIPVARYFAVAMFESDFAKHNWISLIIPKEARKYVYLVNCCKIDGIDWVVPVSDSSTLGGVVGYGNTPDEAIKMCEKNAEGIRGDSVVINVDELNLAKEELEKATKIGIKF